MLQVAEWFKKLIAVFQHFYNLAQEISIDEIMVAFKGRISIKQYCKGKPTDRGFKIFDVCEAKTGYLWMFFLYCGKGSTVSTDTAADEKAASTYVKYLLSGLFFLGHLVVMDNYFSLFSFFVELLASGVYAIGTTRYWYKGFPLHATVAGKNVSRGHHGRMKWAWKQQVLAMSWLDTRPVHLLATGVAATIAEAQVRHHGIGSYFQPLVRMLYNMFMGGVDLLDFRRAYYKVGLKQLKRWWLQLFFWSIDSLVNNTYVVYRN